METWDNNNLPENHQLLENITFVAVTESTWKRKKNDGTEEIAPKWDFISEADDSGASAQISVYSSTDKESLELKKKYDIIVKRAVGKDGTFYGYTLKGFGEAGKPIQRKEPQSRFQKGLQLNARAEAIKAAACVFTGTEVLPDTLIEYAQVLEAYINNEYTKPEEPKKKK